MPRSPLLPATLLVLAAALAPAAFAAPVVTGLTPATAPAAGGVSLTLSGSNFVGSGTAPTVRFGTQRLTPSLFSPTFAVFTCPAARLRSSEEVSVEVDGEVSNAVSCAYAAPSVSSLSPSSAPRSGGMLLTINGSNFRGSFPRVSFEGLGFARPVTADDGQIVVNSPPSSIAGPVTVRVVTHGDSAVAGALAFDGPRIASLSPATIQARGGVLLTINGSNFGASGARNVLVNGIEAKISDFGMSRVVCVTPPLPFEGEEGVVEVQHDGVRSNPFPFTKNRAPVITHVEPEGGRMAGGTPITIYGSNFDAVQSISFGGVAVVPGTVATGRIETLSPPSSTGGPVELTLSDGVASSNLASFEYLSPPQLGSVSVAEAPLEGGTVITVTGSGFGTASGKVQATVKANGSSVGPIRWMAPEALAFTAPAGPAGPVDVTVEVDGVEQTLPAAFARAPLPVPVIPVIGSVGPPTARAAGGTLLTLHGSNFSTAPGGIVLRLGGHPNVAPSIGSVTPTDIVFTLPAGVAGTGMSIVVESDGVASEPASFSYDPPVITSITPSSGPVAGGTLITIRGLDFGEARVSCEGVELGAPLAAAAESVVVVAPGQGSAMQGRYVLRAGIPLRTDPAGPAYSNEALYDYAGPAIASVSPQSVPSAGGVPITIIGTDFADAGAPGEGAFGKVYRAPWRGATVSVTPTEIVTIAPPRGGGTATGGGGGAGGLGDVMRVTRAGLASNPASFQYVGPSITSVSPPAGRAGGGTILTIQGSNFSDLSVVRFGSTVAGPPLDVDADRIVCVTPPGAGTQELQVEDDGLTGLSTFEFLPPPSITGVTPATGPTAGGVHLTIEGLNFGPPGTEPVIEVRLRRMKCSDVTLESPGVLRCLVPPAAAGSADLEVTVDGVTATLDDAFWYTDALDAGGRPVPSRFALSAARPNPARDATRFRLALPTAGRWELDILDAAGRLVRRLAGESDAGFVEVAWDGRAASGARAGAGLYFARARAGGAAATQRLVRLE